MGTEDTFNGAMAAMSFFMAYINMVGEEIGMDRALSLWTKMGETMGDMQGKMMKEQAGSQELDAKTVWSMVKAVPESLGIMSEIVEEGPQEVVVKVDKCPIYTAAQMMGFDPKTIETMCLTGSARVMDGATKGLNPNLGYELRKFRSSADDFCEEAIVKS